MKKEKIHKTITERPIIKEIDYNKRFFIFVSFAFIVYMIIVFTFNFPFFMK